MNTLITAHSGFDNTQVNTLESVAIGFESGADSVELDIRTTKDNIVILFHDDIITTKYGVFKINDLTFSELVELKKNNKILYNIKITRIEEVIEIAKNQQFFNLDLKDDFCITLIIKALKTANMINSVILTGCDVIRASFIKKLYPEVQVLLNVDKNSFKPNVNYLESIKEICHNANSLCCGININYKYLSNEFIDMAYSQYLPISIWTLNKYNQKDYLKIGLYSITTLAVRDLVEKRKKIKFFN